LYGYHRVVVLGHALWQDRFGGAPDIVGRTLRLNGEPYEVVGVLPATAHDQRIFGNARIFRPLGLNERERARRDIGFLSILGRRGAGISVAQGEAFIAASGERAAADFPKENARSGRRAVELQASLRKPPVPALVLLLLGLSTAVLLIACSNLANFLLARAIARTRESAVRTALGASQLQLIRPLAVEALVLAVLGGTGALLVMNWTSAWFNAELTRLGDSPMAFALDWRVLGFTLGVSGLTILFFGLGPAIFTSRIDPEQALKSGSRGATAGRGQQRFRQALIAGQFALATMLVAGAGLFLRGADNLLRADHGWDAGNVVQGYFQLPASSYRAEAKIAAFQSQARERLNQIPGVTAASLSYGLPYRGLSNTRRYVVEGAAVGVEIAANVNGVSPAYFAATGTRLLRGRTFGEGDTPTSPHVAIVSEGFARTLFGAENPLGRRVATPGTAAPEWREIVGVVADVSPAVADGRAENFQLYEPLAQDNWYNGDGKLAELYLAVRHPGVTPEAAIAGVKAALLAIDPDLPVRNLLPATTLVERAVGMLTLLQKLLAGFALLGLLLAALGLYGTIARTVAQRTAEIGIRMALGAQVRDVMRLVLGSGLRLALAGASLGLLGAIGLTRLIVAIFPALRTDPALVLAAAILVLGVIAFLACYLPARQAARVNPLTALRTE
ncbi:MAG: ABC transporter permease, partial [Verrucomicrobia bacterium]|nr:ABC transporter permease [Verrucomicrobiota bacterium]